MLLQAGANQTTRYGNKRERGGQHDHGLTTTHATLPSSTCWCWERNEEDFFSSLSRGSNNPQEKVKYRRRRDVWPCNFTGMHNNGTCMPKIPEDNKTTEKEISFRGHIFGFSLSRKIGWSRMYGDLNAPLGILFFTSRNCGCSHSGRRIVTLAAHDSFSIKRKNWIFA